MKYMMPIQGEWVVYDDNYLRSIDPEDADGLRMLYKEYEKNKLSYFLAHGGGVDFINDRESDFCLLTAGNRRGKSYAGAAWLAVRTVPTDPDWDCYKYGGLQYHEWGGPCKVVACSYTIKDHLRPVIAPILLEILPDDMLKEYSPRYRGKGRKKINWNGEMVLPLPGCGSEVHYRAYVQDQMAFESDAYKYGWLDEQPPLPKIDGLIERGRTGLEKTQYGATMTPHYVPGWPETGAAGPLIRAAKGQIELGISISMYNINTEDVPDCIFPAVEKEKAHKRWVSGPQKSGNLKDIREGQARYYGLPQSSQGLVIDDFDSETHWIDPIKIEEDWTLFRGIDHGTTNPCACVWGAVNPQGFLFIYREYYESQRGINENALEIVKASGNRRVKVHTEYNEYTDVTKNIWDEDFIKEEYEESVMDSRSFGTKQDGAITIGRQYNDAGLYCTKASGKRDSFMIPMMKSWFVVNDKLIHPITGEQGSPRIFIFNTCTHLRNELEGFVYKDNTHDKNASEDPRKKADHLIDAMKYMLATSPEYRGDRYMVPFQDRQQFNTPRRSGPSTGY